MCHYFIIYLVTGSLKHYNENKYDITIPNKKYIIENEIIKISKFCNNLLKRYLNNLRSNKLVGQTNMVNILSIKLLCRI